MKLEEDATCWHFVVSDSSLMFLSKCLIKTNQILSQLHSGLRGKRSSSVKWKHRIYAPHFVKNLTDLAGSSYTSERSQSHIRSQLNDWRSLGLICSHILSLNSHARLCSHTLPGLPPSGFLRLVLPEAQRGELKLHGDSYKQRAISLALHEGKLHNISADDRVH